MYHRRRQDDGPAASEQTAADVPLIPDPGPALVWDLGQDVQQQLDESLLHEHAHAPACPGAVVDCGGPLTVPGSQIYVPALLARSNRTDGMERSLRSISSTGNSNEGSRGAIASMQLPPAADGTTDTASATSCAMADGLLRTMRVYST